MNCAATKYLRRNEAAEYVRGAYGIPCSRAWLAKLACWGGGPNHRKIGRFPVYETADLDAWITSRLSAPIINPHKHAGGQPAAY